MPPEVTETVAAALSNAGYRGLFLAGDHSSASSIWRDGKNRDALMEIVQGECYSELERVLASEVLFQHEIKYPRHGWDDVLGHVYARALAITGRTRWFDLPDVSTTQEAGYPGLVSETFQGMFVPAGTPAPVVQRVAHDTLQALADPTTVEKLRGVGFDVRARGPDGLAERVAREVPMWRDVIVQSRIELQ